MDILKVNDLKIVKWQVSANEFGGEDQLLTAQFPDGTEQTFKRVITFDDT